MAKYKYDENTGEALFDENTGEPILDTVQTESKLPELPPVDPSVDSQYSFVGFANPTTLPKAQKVANQIASEPIRPYVQDAFAYAGGEAQENPNLLGQFIKGNVTGVQRMVDRPFETAATVGSAMLPIAWPSVIAGAGMAGTGTSLDAFHNEDISNKDVYASAGLGALGTGTGTLLGKLAKGISSPVTKALKDYELQTQARTVDQAVVNAKNASNTAELEGIRDILGKRVSELGEGLTDIEQFATMLPGFEGKAVRSAGKALDEANEIAQRETLESIKTWILTKYPEKYAEFAEAYKMGDKEALDYFLELQKKIPTPKDIAEPDFSIKMSDIAGIIPYGYAKSAMERIPSGIKIPSGWIEGLGKTITKTKSVTKPVVVAPLKALEDTVRSEIRKK